MRILSLDIETSPHVAFVWGLWKQNVAISQIAQAGSTICWSAKWLVDKDVMFSSVNATTEADMLETLWELLDEADAVVHYNGQKFDIPTLNKEFVQYGWEPPSPYKQIDLYQTVRKQFKFASNKLDFVCQQLGLGKKVDHKGFELWLGCMNGDPESWEDMEKYNKQDVVLVEELYNFLLPWIDNHPNHALYDGAERPVCPNCGSVHVVKKGIAYARTQMYQRYKCSDCGTNIRSRYTEVDKDKRKNILTQAI